MYSPAAAGANILVRYLGEAGAATQLRAAVSLCNPFDLVSVKLVSVHCREVPQRRHSIIIREGLPASCCLPLAAAFDDAASLGGRCISGQAFPPHVCAAEGEP